MADEGIDWRPARETSLDEDILRPSSSPFDAEGGLKVVDGQITVPEVHMAVDCGYAANPERIRSQMEGAVIFSASLALKSDITLTDGIVDQSNFHDYRILRMHEAPRKIHVLMANNGHRPGGVGEPGVPPVAPAILNGWYALTGERVRTLPMTGRTT